MTSYLRAQVVERKLDQHIGLGRLWRVRHAEGKPLAAAPRNAEEDSTTLVAHLSHRTAGGGTRPSASSRSAGDKSAVPALKSLIHDGTNELAAIHAIWTLEGLGELDRATLAAALDLRHPRAVAEVVRAAESFAGTEEASAAFALLAPLSQNPNLHVRRQVAASLGRFGDPAVPVLAALVKAQEKDLLTGDLAVSGLTGRELALFKALPPKHNLRVPSLKRS